MYNTIITTVLAVLIFATGFVIDRRYSEAAQLAEEVEYLREKLKAAEDERDGLKNTVESTHKLLRAEQERADRLAAMNEGLTEDLAALKAYDPEEIEERLKKIREIRAEEEREKRFENLERLTIEARAQIALSMLNRGGFGSPASACCSLADQQRISWG